jgi:hypothetical protein
VPKLLMYTTLREKLVLGLLKFAPGDHTGQLVRELQSLQSRISAARRVSIQPVEGETDDIADATALAVHLGTMFVDARAQALLRQGRTGRPAPSAHGWT